MAHILKYLEGDMQHKMEKYMGLQPYCWSQDRPVCIVTEGHEFSPRWPDCLWYPPSLLSNGYWGLFPFPGVDRPGCETDLSPPTSAEVKKTWIYTSIPPYTFMA
jgi:hypothetical protein